MVACNFLNSHQIPIFNTGVVRVVIGLWYFILAVYTVTWLNKRSKVALRGDDEASRAVIFPVFANLILILALSDIYFGIILLTVKIDPEETNDTWATLMFSVGFLLQHLVAEGIAIMLMQKGCGAYALKKSTRLAFLYGAFTFGMVFIVYSGNEYSGLAFGFWSGCMIAFYACLWLLPSHVLYRRPAIYIYSKIFLGYRIFILLLVVVIFLFMRDIESGRCLFFIVYLVLDAPVQFLGTYLALLEDSRWWQGIGSSRMEIATKSPLDGFDVSLISAQELAKTLDHMSGSSTANLLNFAHIYLDKKSLLGFGSFSKVYKGKYKMEPVAIKLIFTMDLTESDIQRVASEATILSSINSKNIVKIYGVTVLPPSVCLVLELCMYGSLSDVMRGPHAVLLSRQDRLFLALGCSRGVAALHSLNEYVVHRDIKSFNFLVDDQLNAKLADLELGFDDKDDVKSKQDNEALFQSDFLFNWLAPEVLQFSTYTQASDVYSLSLVLWEIMSGEIPFCEDQNELQSTRDRIIKGRRPSFDVDGISICSREYEKLVTLGWSVDPSIRPAAADFVSSLDKIWRSSGNSNLQILANSRAVPATVSSYLNHLSSLDKLQSIMETDSRFSEFTKDESISIQQISPLRDLYEVIVNDAVWKAIRCAPDPIIIISAQAPHIILSMSSKFESLMGLNQEKYVGLCFEEFVMSPSTVVDIKASNQKVLSDFYVSLKLNKCAHMVITFLVSDKSEGTMSIHAIPIFSKDSVEHEIVADRQWVNLENISKQEREDIDFSNGNADVERDALYYALEMTQLEHIHREEDESQEFLRNWSTGSISSRFSGLFRGTNSTPHSRHYSMQANNRSQSFNVSNRNAEISTRMRTSYSSGNLRDSLVSRESISSNV